jgi:Protein of unknown function (DUF2924)
VDPELQREIESLRGLKVKALKARYQDLFGEVSPSWNRIHLFRRIAWRLQARAEGDLSERARHRAAELAQDADIRLRAPRRFWAELTQTAQLTGAEGRCPAKDARLPPVGTKPERSYRGSQIVVLIRGDGFAYNGQVYSSLSAIAYQVTGTRWNGFLFFGLKQEWSRE